MTTGEVWSRLGVIQSLALQVFTAGDNQVSGGLSDLMVCSNCRPHVVADMADTKVLFQGMFVFPLW